MHTLTPTHSYLCEIPSEWRDEQGSGLQDGPACGSCGRLIPIVRLRTRHCHTGVNAAITRIIVCDHTHSTWLRRVYSGREWASGNGPLGDGRVAGRDHRDPPLACTASGDMIDGLTGDASAPAGDSSLTRTICTGAAQGRTHDGIQGRRSPPAAGARTCVPFSAFTTG